MGKYLITGISYTHEGKLKKEYFEDPLQSIDIENSEKNLKDLLYWLKDLKLIYHELC